MSIYCLSFQFLFLCPFFLFFSFCSALNELKEVKEDINLTSKIDKHPQIKNKITTEKRNRFLANNFGPSYSYQSSNYFLSEIYGNSNDLNYYYTTLYIGNHKEPQTLIIDTTSSITTAPCSFCTECGEHINSPYQIEENANVLNCDSDFCKKNVLSNECYANEHCAFDYEFFDKSSLKGIYVENKIWFENLEETKKEISKSYAQLPIGCTIKEDSFFKVQAPSGILGLANNNKNFVTLAFNKGFLNNNLFTLCFGTHGGYISLGEINADFHKKNEKIIYIPLSLLGGNYEFTISEFVIKGKKIKYRVDAIIDSASTISYFPKNLYFKIIGDLIYTDDSSDESSDFTYEKIDQIGYCIIYDSKIAQINKKIKKEYFPDILIKVGDVTLNWKSQNYIIDFSNSSSDKYKLCFGIKDSDNSNKIIFGTNFLKGNDVIFDREEFRLGFIEADCSRGELTNKDWTDNLDKLIIPYTKSLTKVENVNVLDIENMDDEAPSHKELIDQEKEVSKEKENTKENSKENTKETEKDDKKSLPQKSSSDINIKEEVDKNIQQKSIDQSSEKYSQTNTFFIIFIVFIFIILILAVIWYFLKSKTQLGNNQIDYNSPYGRVIPPTQQNEAGQTFGSGLLGNLADQRFSNSISSYNKI